MKLPRNIEDAVADFRGLPRASAHEWDSGAANMGSLLEVLIEKYKIGQERPEQTIMAHWREIMGDNAARCAPERIDTQGRLVVQVSNPILRRELAFTRRPLVQKLRHLKGCEHITDIEFRAG
ncbi:MAG TPA: DUF721 domain-containing protein [Opitutales bacterium]|nr:DUF721 domain-containing protein [Opitutales bacterium]